MSHHRTLPSSSEPTNKKHPNPSTSTPFVKDSDPIIKSFSKLCTSTQKGAVLSNKDPVFKPKSHTETGFRAKPVSVNEFQDKPMSKISQKKAAFFSKSPIHLSKPQSRTIFEEAKPVFVSDIQDKPMSKTSQKKAAFFSNSPNFLANPQMESTFQAKPISVSEIEDKPMSKSSQKKAFAKSPSFLTKSQNEGNFLAKPVAELSHLFAKSPNFHSKTRIETNFEAKPISVSANQEKPISKSSHQRRRSAMEVEKEKLRASITGVLEKPDKGHDFKIENKGELKKVAKKERVKEETNVSLSKSQDSGLKVAHRSDGKRQSFSLGVTGGRRRSFCNSQAELADFFSCNAVKIVSVDMPPFMQIHAVDCARKTCDSLEKFTSKTLAFTLKKEFDGVYGPAWHCIVGSSFGSFVTHSVGGFMYFSIDHKIYILLFKTTVQKAAD